MEKLLMCRICLVENVRMHVVVDKKLHELYEKLTDIPFVTEDNRPLLACFFCYAKLKKCFSLQRKCLEAEELFAQMMGEGHEPKLSVNRDHIESFSGFIKTPIEHTSTVDSPQIESITIKEELPDICEDIIELKKENQSNDLEPEIVDKSCLDVELTLSHHSESHTLGDVPLMTVKIEVEEELEVPKNGKRAVETCNLESENVYNSCLDVEDIPPLHSESDSEGDVPLMTFKTEVKVEQEVSRNKRRAVETSSASDAKKLKLDARRTKLENAIAAELKRNEQSNLTSQNITAESIKKSYKCDQRSSNLENNLKNHTSTQSLRKSYKCDVCQRSFSQKSNLTSHVRIHTGEKPYKCNICQRSFSIKDTLTKHVRLHTGEKPNKCDVCHTSFTQKSALTKHIRIHTGEKSLKCDLCQSSFTQKSALTKHIRIHTGEKSLKCDVCQRSFCQKSTLTKHVLICTGEKALKCNVCQRSFSRKNLLASHIRKHTDEKPNK